MTPERGDMMSMWGKTDLFVFTSNPIVNKDGLAVMGRGIAKQVADSHPDVRRRFGEHLRYVYKKEGFGYLGRVDEQEVGFFMVKSHWKDSADLQLIALATYEMDLVVRNILLFNPSYRIDLNFPGIGNGRLRREHVLPIIETLPDNVHVWEY